MSKKDPHGKKTLDGKYDKAAQKHLRKIKKKRIRLKPIWWRFIKCPIVQIFAHWNLCSRGRRDGKRGIPNGANGQWMSPTIRRESADVEAFDAWLWRRVEKRTSLTRMFSEIVLADLATQAVSINKIKERLKDKIPPELDVTIDDGLPQHLQHMLSTVRANEQDLDPIGLRLRRFKEYQRLLRPLRSQMIQSQQDVEKLTLLLTDSLEEISAIENQARLVKNEFIAYVNRRITYYWQSVTRHHSLKGSIPSQPPLLPPAEDTYREAHHTFVDTKIKEALAIRDTIINL